MLKINVRDIITLHEGNYNRKKIYYIVKYGTTYTPEVYVYDKEKFDLLLRGRSDISMNEYNTYLSICKICITTFSDRNFEPTYKTKARHVNYYYY